MLLFCTLALAKPNLPSASTTQSKGAWTIEGLDVQTSHTHGGAPANLGHSRFKITYTGTDPAQLSVAKIEFLTDNDCKKPTQVQREVALGGLFPEDDSLSESQLSLSIKRGETTILVGYPNVEGYQSTCDRFAFRVHFQAGDVALAPISETHVIRREPLRR